MTLLSVLLGVLAAMSYVSHWVTAAVILLLLSGFCDSLDGTLARLEKKTSNIGAAIDIVGDRVVEFVIIFALYLADPYHHALGAIAMLGASYICVTTFLIVGVFTDNESQKSFYYSAGLMERAEAFTFFIVMMIFPKAFFWLAWIYFLLVMYTAVIRMKEFVVATQRHKEA